MAAILRRTAAGALLREDAARLEAGARRAAAAAAASGAGRRRASAAAGGKHLFRLLQPLRAHGLRRQQRAARSLRGWPPALALRRVVPPAEEGATRTQPLPRGARRAYRLKWRARLTWTRQQPAASRRRWDRRARCTALQR